MFGNFFEQFAPVQFLPHYLTFFTTSYFLHFSVLCFGHVYAVPVHIIQLARPPSLVQYDRLKAEDSFCTASLICECSLTNSYDHKGSAELHNIN